MDELLYIESPKDSEFVSLSGLHEGKDGNKYRLLRKKILPMNGSFVHPLDNKTKIFIDEKVAKSIKANFEKGMVGKVTVPTVDDDNKHSENPLNNLGVVQGIDYDSTGVYATIEARKHAEDFGETILDSSAFIHMNYMDTDTGQRVGPTLLHVAATNRGHVRNMGDYEEIVKASADISDETILFLSDSDSVAVLDKVEDTKAKADEKDDKQEIPTQAKESVTNMLTKDEVLAFLKDNSGVAAEFLKSEGVDVEALQADATRAAELSAQLDDVNSQLKLSADSQLEVTDLAEALIQLSASDKSKGERIAALEAENAQREAETAVDSLVQAGRVLPANRDAYVQLKMSNQDLFDSIVPADSIIALSERGVTVHEESTRSEKVQEAVKNYVSRAQGK